MVGRCVLGALAAAVALAFATLIVLCVVVLRSFRRVRPAFRDDLTLLGKAITTHRPTWIVGGMMGSGKTTFARVLALSLGITHLEIDRYDSEDALLTAIDCASRAGWVAEANLWQVPQSVVERATVIVFLDYDNVVNYLRLLKRGSHRWQMRQFSWRAFKEQIVEEIILDLWRIVYRYGKSNRRGWRENGLFTSVDGVSAVTLRCISPAELRLLLEFITS